MGNKVVEVMITVTDQELMDSMYEVWLANGFYCMGFHREIWEWFRVKRTETPMDQIKVAMVEKIIGETDRRFLSGGLKTESLGEYLDRTHSIGGVIRRYLEDPIDGEIAGDISVVEDLVFYLGECTRGLHEMLKMGQLLGVEQSVRDTIDEAMGMK